MSHKHYVLIFIKILYSHIDRARFNKLFITLNMSDIKGYATAKIFFTFITANFVQNDKIY